MGIGDGEGGTEEIIPDDEIVRDEEVATEVTVNKGLSHCVGDEDDNKDD